MYYLTELTGIHVTYERARANFPHYIMARYEIKDVLLDHIHVFFLYPKGEQDQVTAIKKHILKIQQQENKPAVLILDRLTARERDYLLRERIPFIVEKKQIYLPFMAIYLQEKCDAPKIACDKLLPSAQLLLFYYIYNNRQELFLSVAARKLSVTATSAMRAANQLVEAGIMKTKKMGVQRVIYSSNKSEELFEAAKKYMVSPIKKVIYVDQSDVSSGYLYSGYSALARYTMLNEPEVPCYAIKDRTGEFTGASERLMDSKSQCKCEIWRYNPAILSVNDCVDELSLSLALMQDEDERVEEAVGELLEKVWERLGGYRN